MRKSGDRNASFFLFIKGESEGIKIESKNQIRERIWMTLEKEGVALFPGANGRIPNFKGAEVAARFISTLPQWQKTKNMKVNPDLPQRPVRYLALTSGKTIYMAVPRLREKKCFVKLEPSRIPSKKLYEASSIKGAFRFGVPVHPKEINPIDLVVAGSVAVNKKGSRIGKGGGYSDLEYAIGREFGFIKEGVVITTTVHPLQIIAEDLPETDHDFRIDFIATPGEIISIHREGGRPKGIIRDHLTEEKISDIPILKEVLPSLK